MAVELATAYVSLVPSARGLSGAIASELGGAGVAGAAATSGRRAALAFSGGFAAAGVAGAGVLAIAENFDAAFDRIAITTGATGAQMEGLEDSFRAVFGSVPSDADSVATAIGDIHARLSLTGPALEQLSIQMVNLSRMTDTDLQGNIREVTRLFGDWGVAADDQSGALDRLFRVSQSTGISVSDLGSGMVRYGAPLRQLGFDMDTATAMLGKFEAEGVNTSLVLGSMRMALSTMALDGEPAVETFARVTDEIRNAGSVSEANRLAIELFGARAGPDMAAAIREGRFELTDLVGSMRASTGAINHTAEATDDFREKWDLMSNKLALLLAPGAEDLMTRVTDGASDFVAAYESGGWGGVLSEMVNKFEELGVLFLDTVGLDSWIDDFKSGMDRLTDAWGPFWQRFESGRQKLRRFFTVEFGGFVDDFQSGVQRLTDAWGPFWQRFSSGADRVGNWFGIGGGLDDRRRALEMSVKAKLKTRIAGKFHEGGVVPGPPGTESLAVLEAGERVIPAGQPAAAIVQNNHYYPDERVTDLMERDRRALARLLPAYVL